MTSPSTIAFALRLGLANDVFAPDDVVAWAEGLMQDPDVGDNADLVELATTWGEPRAWYLDRLARLARVDATSAPDAAQVVLAAAFLLRQRGVRPTDVAQRIGAATRDLRLTLGAHATFVEALAVLRWAEVLTFFSQMNLEGAPPCLSELPRFPTLVAVVEPWSRRTLAGSLEAAHLARLRLPHVTADEQTATELVLVDAASSVLAEVLEHRRLTELPEPGTVEAMATAFTTTIASLDTKRGWGAEVRSSSLEALVSDSPIGSGPWLGQMRRFSAHLQTTEVRDRLSRG